MGGLRCALGVWWVIAAAACASAPGSPRDDAARAAPFRGTCHWGRRARDPARYRLRVRVRPQVGDSAPVRSTARFGPGRDNLLGRVDRGDVLAAEGPLTEGRRVGYAVLVRDPLGRACRGYLSARDARETSRPRRR